jgi:hypothetical protein
MGYTICHTGVEADYTKEVGYSFFIFSFSMCHPMDKERFTNNASGILSRIQRTIGVLEDDRHFPSQGSHLVLRPLSNILAFKKYLPCGGLKEPHHATACRSLSAARLTDKSQRFSFLYHKADTVDGFHIIHFTLKQSTGHRKVHF